MNIPFLGDTHCWKASRVVRGKHQWVFQILSHQNHKFRAMEQWMKIWSQDSGKSLQRGHFPSAGASNPSRINLSLVLSFLSSASHAKISIRYGIRFFHNPWIIICGPSQLFLASSKWNDFTEKIPSYGQSILAHHYLQKINWPDQEDSTDIQIQSSLEAWEDGAIRKPISILARPINKRMLHENFLHYSAEII